MKNYMPEELHCTVYQEPFPHLIVKNYYNEEELELIWEELKFYTKPGKLLEAKDFGGVVDATNSHAISLDALYIDYSKQDNNNSNVNYRLMSNILTVSRKLFNSGILDVFSDIHGCCSIAKYSNWDINKIRYYHNGEYYEPHTDKAMQFLAFYYIHKEPKKFTGGEVYFPEYDYEFNCDNNSMIILPGWVQHGVREVKIEDSDYYDGWGRYAITTFFGNKFRKSWG
tara:strand:- start:103 stop:780 length:678 start_codon:yes stop_codon:yes gene_type:complete